MGAENFIVRARGKTAKKAFEDAVADAQHENGHGGYTGTIAEKDTFVFVTPKEGESPRECADRLLDADDPKTCDKWGPCGCIHVKDDQYLFFGVASS